ncbi:hypothetical protein THAOC_16632 [Thalassiosira oceanica]|uniref:Fatty acid desaturase domain-containing protein n=1 Tax=Thalassiosira oceanica TaxID=159749 RepID=K0SX18_THAOC|nr:hypothetical protein THAOC_16632 [Thalassiosira oceanica]|eukprot:EJK62742.1 hypothetical protein THAOC_16632 [Thalassiosira oceanica]
MEERPGPAGPLAAALRVSELRAINAVGGGPNVDLVGCGILRIRCAESSRGARLSSSFADIDKFVERGPTIMSPPRRMPAEDRNFPTAENRPAFEQPELRAGATDHRCIVLRSTPRDERTEDASPRCCQNEICSPQGGGLDLRPTVVPPPVGANPPAAARHSLERRARVAAKVLVLRGGSGRQRQERKTEEMTRSEGSSSSSDITTTTNTNNTNIILPPPLPPAQGLVLAMCRATVYTVSYGPWSSTVKMATVKMASTLGYVISDLGTEMRMQAEAVGDGANGGLPFHLLLPLVLVVAFWLVSHTLYMWLILGGMHNFFSHEGGGAYKRGQRVHHERPPPIKLTPLRRLRRLLWAVASCLVGQMGPLWWASIHRRHHRYCDGPQDPHSPLQRGFLGAHLGWIVDPANFAVRDEELRDDLLAQDRHPWDLLIVELFCLHLDQWLTERVVNTASFQLLRILPASVLLIRVGSRRLPLRLRLAALGAVSLGKFTAWHSVWLVNSWNHHPKGGGKVGMGGGDCCLARNLPGMAWFAVLSLGESRRHGHHHKVYPPPPSEKVA